MYICVQIFIYTNIYVYAYMNLPSNTQDVGWVHASLLWTLLVLDASCVCVCLCECVCGCARVCETEGERASAMDAASVGCVGCA